jgi:UDP-N-acetyl-D-galactosamine dehydrogenase
MTHQRKTSIIGLGYVGLPVALAFAQVAPTIGFDINVRRITDLKLNKDITKEVSKAELQATSITFTSDINELKQADFHIVAVPTPINSENKPDLTLMCKASESVASILKPGDIVVYESTVYPGVTEEICLPILEKISGLKCGQDFSIGYSPERINPSDKTHTFTNITKVVSGYDTKTLKIISQVYGSVVSAGIHEAPSIRVAEAAKIIENTQRDVNIALMNELSMIFNKMDINTLDVLEAAGTKWNFLPFKPGLVGGHCIGVDPYYLAHKADEKGHNAALIKTSRSVNNQASHFVADKCIHLLQQANIPLIKAKVGILGLTFKENCNDIRNSKVIDIINDLQARNIEVVTFDPLADKEDLLRCYDVKMNELADFKGLDTLIIAVNHDEFYMKKQSFYQDMFDKTAIYLDLKGSLQSTLENENAIYWSM